LLDSPKTKARFVAAKLRRQLRMEHDQTMQAIDLKWTEQLDTLSEKEIEDAMAGDVSL